MSDEHTGFVWDIKQPTRDGYVACLVITPKDKGGGADKEAKLERNMGRHQALRIAEEMLEACAVPADLLARVKALREAAGPG
jgi:hypothetical protein